MKFAFVTLSVIFAGLTVQAAVTPNLDEDPLTIKLLNITCQSVNQVQNCKSGIMLAAVKAGVQDKFSDIAGGYFNFVKILTNFFGSCTEAKTILKNITGCGLQDCPTIQCSAPT